MSLHVVAFDALDSLADDGIPIAMFGDQLVVRKDIEGDQVIDLDPDGDEEFIPWPEIREGKRDVSLIAGPSGVGKSTLAAKMITTFNLAFPGSPVWCFSQANIHDDQAFQDLDITQLELGVDYEPKSFANETGRSLVLFDDVENMHCKENDECLRLTLTGVLERGRKLGIHILLLLHRPAASSFTKLALSEATSYTWFPATCSGNYAYALNRYAEVPESVRKNMCGPEYGRWIQYHREHPQYVVSEKLVALYDAKTVEKAVRILVKKEKKVEDAEVKKKMAELKIK